MFTFPISLSIPYTFLSSQLIDEMPKQILKPEYRHLYKESSKKTHISRRPEKRNYKHYYFVPTDESSTSPPPKQHAKEYQPQQNNTTMTNAEVKNDFTITEVRLYQTWLNCIPPCVSKEDLSLVLLKNHGIKRFYNRFNSVEQIVTSQPTTVQQSQQFINTNSQQFISNEANNALAIAPNATEEQQHMSYNTL